MRPTRQKDLTKEESIIGTLQYMAPEQLEAKSADARTDIFAFGLVLYEMITGRRAFEGKSRASLIASIMGKEPPPISTVESMSPPTLDHVVARCLAKEPDDRWQSASDVMSELKWIAEGGSQADVSIPVEAHGRNRGRWWGVAGLVVGVLAALAMVAWNLMPPVAPPALTRFGIVLPSTQRLTGTGQLAVAFSPDGKRLAYIGNDQLYLREMDQMEASPVRGTDVGPEKPFLFSRRGMGRFLCLCRHDAKEGLNPWGGTGHPVRRPELPWRELGTETTRLSSDKEPASFASRPTEELQKAWSS